MRKLRQVGQDIGATIVLTIPCASRQLAVVSARNYGKLPVFGWCSCCHHHNPSGRRSGLGDGRRKKIRLNPPSATCTGPAPAPRSAPGRSPAPTRSPGPSAGASAGPTGSPARRPPTAAAAPTSARRPAAAGCGCCTARTAPPAGAAGTASRTPAPASACGPAARSAAAGRTRSASA